MKKRLFFIMLIMASLFLSNITIASARSNSTIDTTQFNSTRVEINKVTPISIDSSTIEPNAIIGFLEAKTYLSTDSTQTKLWYRGILNSSDPWLSASSQMDLLYMLPVGGSWELYQSYPKVNMGYGSYMETPTYTYMYAYPGYWIARNNAVVYYGPSYYPSSIANSYYSNQITIELQN